MVNTKRYDIDYTKFVKTRIPFELLGFEDLFALLMILVGSVTRTYNQLITHRNLLLYKLSITPQVCYLEKMLNTQYDPTERRIYIEDGKQFAELFIYQEAEEQPVFLYQEDEEDKPEIFIYTQGEGTGEGSFDFVVYVPVAVPFNIDEMGSLIRTFKLAGKLFYIQTF